MMPAKNGTALSKCFWQSNKCKKQEKRESKLKIISNTTNFQLEQGTAVAIGKFDGVHIGHRRLLEEILKRKEEGLLACVFTFDPPPEVLFGIYEKMKEIFLDDFQTIPVTINVKTTLNKT